MDRSFAFKKFLQKATEKHIDGKIFL